MPSYYATEFEGADDDFPGISLDEISLAGDVHHLLGLDPLSANVDGQGGTINGKPVWTLDQVISNLNRSNQAPNPGVDIRPGWQDGSLDSYKEILKSGDAMEFRFGFHTQESINAIPFFLPGGGGRGEAAQFAAFTDAQRAAAREAVDFWDDLMAPTFVETAPGDADINFANLTASPNTQAYAYLPYNYAPPFDELTGDVFVGASQASNFQFLPNGYGMNTLTHEIGHALGLSHPGAYNFGPGFSVTYANGAEYFQDARNYSIMSYWNPRDVGARDFNWDLGAIAYGGTPMIHDIATIQWMYGADPTTRTGNTTYGFNSNAGKDVFDFTKNAWPTIAIYDAGGNDTLDASGYKVNQLIDLTPGALSSIGGILYEDRPTFEQVNANRAAFGYAPVSLATYTANMNAFANNPTFLGRLTDNVGIAYGTYIENAVGGSGNDVLVSNSVANVLNGGDGVDTASYRSALSGVTASLASKSGTGGEAAGDRYISIEQLEGSKFADTLLGGNANDGLWGLDGNDTLSGGNGNDTLDGGLGDDTLDGGNGADTLAGGDGADLLRGGNEADVLNGGAGIDRLEGGNGDDKLNGGTGNDTLLGGNGNDIFIIADQGGLDVIADFRRGADKIDVSALGDFTWVGSGAFSGTGGAELRGYSQFGDFYLSGDVNGDGISDFMIEVNTSLTSADIILT
ncbi:M10 family metallopeptidase C-terminal domain-containing protein [Sphingosinicella sp. LHD-64]|uniref:M10 family metallopeptidase C-terminal domain-containing protein n=1 Tax=Sphingosinicella sp. LHD-64 TaxID=3072139 RepID=UPI00280FBDDF|nr:M10 family metallopeptidase C-terminal domain-containing protein [Sphingosinicella sp. LHD-64]MDQ8755732.1 M10 family metallopeptidase C-terminal domain-containing protein [Sphingosinicella sp. LHD-64]